MLWVRSDSQQYPYLIIGALAIAFAALGYELYQARKQPPKGE